MRLSDMTEEQKQAARDRDHAHAKNKYDRELTLRMRNTPKGGHMPPSRLSSGRDPRGDTAAKLDSIAARIDSLSSRFDSFCSRRRADAGPKEMSKAYVRCYEDSGQVQACVEWSDGSRTTGEPDSTHMQQLLARAKREGKFQERRDSTRADISKLGRIGAAGLLGAAALSGGPGHDGGVGKKPISVTQPHNTEAYYGSGRPTTKGIPHAMRKPINVKQDQQ